MGKPFGSKSISTSTSSGRRGERNWKGESRERRPISSKCVNSKAGRRSEEEEQGSGSLECSIPPDSKPSAGEREEEEENQVEEKAIQAFQFHQIHHLHQLQQQQAASRRSSSATTASSAEYARLSARMGDEGNGGHHQYYHEQQQRPLPHSRYSRMRGAGEIVEVQGGHIVRSTGRKDRHSKVCTAKGPRDRRVRLAAHTAIQFYDVQDRLGYDRPSKAVDWLIQNAKAAIADLAELPAWYPTASAANSQDDLEPSGAAGDHPIRNSGIKQIPADEAVGSVNFGFGSGGSSASFLPTSLDSDAIFGTIKSFFPLAADAAATAASPIAYQNYPPDLLSCTNSQDLRLSLQSFQDPIFHHPNPTHRATTASAPSSFDASWPEQSLADMGGGGGGGGYVFSVPPPEAVPLHSVLGQSQFFTQRGTLQSSNSPSVHAWTDQMASSADHHMHPELPPWVSSIGLASAGGFSGFRIPARIQGEEEHDGTSD